MITARGISGQIAFDGQSVTITRRGLLPWLLAGSGGTKSIPLKSVSAVQHRKCGFYQGYLQLSIAGELEGGGSGGGHGRFSEHLPFVKDENTLIFYFRSNAEFTAMTDTLRSAIRDAANGVTPGNGQPVVAAGQTGASAADASQHIFAEITQLADLRDRRAITPAEFNAKKAELLSRL